MISSYIIREYMQEGGKQGDDFVLIVPIHPNMSLFHHLYMLYRQGGASSVPSILYG